MSIWSSLAKGAMSAAKGTGKGTLSLVRGTGNNVLKPIGRSVVSGVAHPTATLRGLGTAAKSATIGGGVGYLAWQNIVNDKSVVETVTEVAVGKDTTEKIGEAIDDVKELKEKAGEAVDGLNNAMTDVNSKWSGISNFFRGIFGGNPLNMFGNFFGNLAHGNVSGLSLIGLVASAFLTFGRFGWMTKIAGALLGMMMIGNNSNMRETLTAQNNAVARNEQQQGQRQEQQQEEQAQSHGMRR